MDYPGINGLFVATIFPDQYIFSPLVKSKNKTYVDRLGYLNESNHSAHFPFVLRLNMVKNNIEGTPLCR